MEIGIDIEKNIRFKNMSEKHLNRIFSERELTYAKKYKDFYVHLCAMWCVKEAFVKATKVKTMDCAAIEILHNEDGSPYIFVNEKIHVILKQLNCSQIKISISHTKAHSTAVCLIC